MFKEYASSFSRSSYTTLAMGTGGAASALWGWITQNINGILATYAALIGAGVVTLAFVKGVYDMKKSRAESRMRDLDLQLRERQAETLKL